MQLNIPPLLQPRAAACLSSSLARCFGRLSASRTVQHPLKSGDMDPVASCSDGEHQRCNLPSGVLQAAPLSA